MYCIILINLHGGVHVKLAELHRVRLQHAFLQVPGSEVEPDVQRVQQVGQIVEGQPDANGGSVDLLEGEPVDHDPEVVEEGDAHHH